MSGERGDSEGGLGVTAPIRLPLNSKRLTANHLRRLAAELEIATSASTDELRQMIDGKLSEAGRQALNVQAVLSSSQPTSEFSLEDAEGKFLTVQEAEPEISNDYEPSEHDGGECKGRDGVPKRGERSSLWPWKQSC